MPIPRVAIVGRPNVGKSSLLNLIARNKVAIVDPTPGVTRDRVSAIVDLESPDQLGPLKPIELTDTGGFGVYVAEGKRYDEVGADLATLTQDIEHQIAEAVSHSDLILFAIDTQAGITAQDEAIAKMLREQKLGSRTREGREPVPVRVIATKVDGPKWETHAYELSALGFGEPLMCSAQSKYMRRDMLDKLYAMMPEPDDEPRPYSDLSIAIVGKRNAGKSTLVNTLAGEERVIVSEIAGTTRDAVDVMFEMDGRTIMAIDTAGLRRKKSFQDRIEWYAFDRAQRAIDRADVVLLLIDATERISQVDEQLAALVVKSFKPVVIVINKWDEVEGRANPSGKTVTTEDFDDYVRKELKGLSFAPLAFMSAKEGTNIRGVIELASDLHEQATGRVSTGKINRLIRSIVERRGPSNKLGTEAKVYYATQVTTAPPTLVLVVNRPELFTPNYMRFLMNRLREELPFEEVPIRVLLRSRKRVEAQQRGRRGGRDLLHKTDPETGQFVDEMGGVGAELDEMLAAMPDEGEAYFED
ncbi:MAG: ribosome biogenesis GTPase Der [Phycisphaerales bacterium JB059]